MPEQMTRTPRVSSEPRRAVKAVATQLSPPSQTRFLRTTSLVMSRVNPATWLSSQRQTVSLLYSIWPGHTDDTRIKRSHGKTSTSTQVLSPDIHLQL